MNETMSDVMIVGAGPTGLTLATILARFGINYRIVDKNSAAVIETRALGVQARTLELWHKLGWADNAIADGLKINDLYFLSKATRQQRGKPLLTFGYDGAALTPYPYMLVFEQYKTERMMLDDLAGLPAGSPVERDIELIKVEPHHDFVTVHLQHANGDVEIAHTRYLVGCDGANSFVRRACYLDFDGETYDEAMFVADVDLDWTLDNDKLYVELPHHGMLAFFPMRGHSYGDTHYRMLGRLPIGMEDRKQLTQAELQAILDEHSVVDATISQTRWTSVYRIHRRMAEKFRYGNVFIAGDAAHIHSPAGGQGMNTGIQDAWNLAWKLALVLRDEAEASLLDSYSPERVPVARAILTGSDRGFSFIASPNIWIHQIRSRILPLLSTEASRRITGRKLFQLVSQVWIGYRGSEAVGETGAHDVTAGDRAPHAWLNDGRNVHDLLTGVDHHLLQFGDAAPTPELATLLDSFKLTVQQHVIRTHQQAAHTAYDVETPTMMLVRPDGHVAWRGGMNDVAGLERFMTGRFKRTAVLAHA